MKMLTVQDVEHIINHIIMLNKEEMQLAFAFSAGEFLDEELELLHLDGPLEENDPFLKDGEARYNKDSNHPYEWWATKSSIDNLNAKLNLVNTKE